MRRVRGVVHGPAAGLTAPQNPEDSLNWRWHSGFSSRVSSPRPTAVTRRCGGSDDSDRSPSPRHAVAEGETQGIHPSASRGSPGFSIRASLSDRRHLCGFADAYVPAKVYGPGDAATTAVLE